MMMCYFTKDQQQQIIFLTMSLSPDMSEHISVRQNVQNVSKV